jgi:NAD(P)-dependent dehydrogenase (short-subunit alcohol dehydrogenase family)
MDVSDRAGIRRAADEIESRFGKMHVLINDAGIGVLASRRFRDEIMAQGMDPMEAGKCVIQGIRRNELYILSHPEFEAAIHERFDAILRSLPRAEDVPPARLRAEARTLTNPIYAGM